MKKVNNLNEYFILYGDSNLVLNNPRVREKLVEIMDDLQLLNYIRVLNPNKEVFTWQKKHSIETKSS